MKAKYEIRIAAPGQPVRYARTYLGAKIKTWLLEKFVTFGTKTITVTKL